MAPQNLTTQQQQQQRKLRPNIDTDDIMNDGRKEEEEEVVVNAASAMGRSSSNGDDGVAINGTASSTSTPAAGARTGTGSMMLTSSLLLSPLSSSGVVGSRDGDCGGGDGDGYVLRWSRLRKTVDMKELGRKKEGLVGCLGSCRSSLSYVLGHNNRAKNDDDDDNINNNVNEHEQNHSSGHDRTILNNVSGIVYPGEMLACMGPSGAGKTSLMNILSGRSTFQDGTIALSRTTTTTTTTMKRTTTMPSSSYSSRSDNNKNAVLVSKNDNSHSHSSSSSSTMTMATTPQSVSMHDVTTSSSNSATGNNPSATTATMTSTERDVTVFRSSSTMKRFLKGKVAYVKQSDTFFQHLTVRDQLTYTALLRMPSSSSSTTTTTNQHNNDNTTTKNNKRRGQSQQQHHHHQQRRSTIEDIAVDRIIRLLRLSKVANSTIQMLSGGEKKRLQIGTELITSPSILLLDEPTSGLDSSSAVDLLRLLHNLSQTRGKTIITTIHQPNSYAFHTLFHRLIMLSNGRCVYFGRPCDSISYLQSVPNVPQCLSGYNAADHWMDLLVLQQQHNEQHDEQHQNSDGDDNDDDDDEGVILQYEQQRITTPPSVLLQEAWDNEALALQVDHSIQTALANATTAAAASSSSSSSSSTAVTKRIPDSRTNTTIENSNNNDNNNSKKYNTTWIRQYYVLTHRSLKNSRSAIFTTMNIIKSVALGLVAGLLWFNIEYLESNMNDIRSFNFFTNTFWIFDSMFTALSTFPIERYVIIQERQAGSYQLSAYFMAKTTSDAPVRLILPMLYVTVAYWIIGLNAGSEDTNVFLAFLGILLCTLLSVFAGEAIGLMIGTAVYDMEKALTLMTVITLFFMLLGGFFIEDIPQFLTWAKYLSPFKYAFDSSLLLVFQRNMFCDESSSYSDGSGGGGGGSGELHAICFPQQQQQQDDNDTTSQSEEEEEYLLYANAEDIRDYIGVQGSLSFNLGMLIILGIIPRYIAYWFLKNKKGHERS